jgi:hypothetical protein
MLCGHSIHSVILVWSFMQPALRISGLNKKFGDNFAVNNLDRMAREKPRRCGLSRGY